MATWWQWAGELSSHPLGYRSGGTRGAITEQWKRRDRIKGRKGRGEGQDEAGVAAVVVVVVGRQVTVPSVPWAAMNRGHRRGAGDRRPLVLAEAGGRGRWEW